MVYLQKIKLFLWQLSNRNHTHASANYLISVKALSHFKDIILEKTVLKKGNHAFFCKTQIFSWETHFPSGDRRRTDGGKRGWEAQSYPPSPFDAYWGGGTEPNSPTEVVQQAACENQLPRTADSAPIAAMNNRCGIFWRIHNYFSKRQIYWRGNVAENLLFLTAHNSEK